MCIDSLGAKKEVCGGRLEWHATIPLSAALLLGIRNQPVAAAVHTSPARPLGGIVLQPVYLVAMFGGVIG